MKQYSGYTVRMSAAQKVEGQCRSCRWWENWEDGDHVCGNDESENFADWTEWNDRCDVWEGKTKTGGL